MSDAAITVVVAGVGQVAVLVIGLLTLWVKLKYGVDQTKRSADDAKDKAQTVEDKLDLNTATTIEVSRKTDTIVDQTNGVLTNMQVVVGKIAERVEKLEDYNHTSSHRLFNAINAVHLRLMTVTSLPSANNSPNEVKEGKEAE